MDNSTKQQCLSDFLNVSFDQIYFMDGFFYYNEKVFVIATEDEAEEWSRNQLIEQLHQFSLNLILPYIDVKNIPGIEINQNALQSAMNLVFKYGAEAEKQAFILQSLEPNELERFIRDRLQSFKESEHGFAPFLSKDGKQHFSRQYNLYLYRYYL
jgi:hypothetical protein